MNRGLKGGGYRNEYKRLDFLEEIDYCNSDGEEMHLPGAHKGPYGMHDVRGRKTCGNKTF